MSKNMSVVVFALLITIQMFCFTSCEKKETDYEKKDINKIMEEVFYKEYLIDDVSLLKDVLTIEYDLNELQTFFENSNENENIGFGSSANYLSFDDVNSKFPIEVLRSKYYSVYRVQQGGYYYVFWARNFGLSDLGSSDFENFNTDTLSEIEPYVHFSTYLTSSIEVNEFDTLISGKSTAEDVKKIDPSFELTFLMSSGPYSYSYLNAESLLMIKYTVDGSLKSYNNLIIKEKKVVTRSSVSSCLGSILSHDLP